MVKPSNGEETIRDESAKITPKRANSPGSSHPNPCFLVGETWRQVLATMSATWGSDKTCHLSSKRILRRFDFKCLKLLLRQCGCQRNREDKQDILLLWEKGTDHNMFGEHFILGLEIVFAVEFLLLVFSKSIDKTKTKQHNPTHKRWQAILWRVVHEFLVFCKCFLCFSLQWLCK